jgi:chemotaxis response regulator CheB
MASNSTAADADVRPPSAFPVVGIGASAGGLEALSELVKQITLDHIALVIVQHLSPNHTSMLPELLGRVTTMKVVGRTRSSARRSSAPSTTGRRSRASGSSTPSRASGSDR